MPEEAVAPLVFDELGLVSTFEIAGLEAGLVASTATTVGSFVVGQLARAGAGLAFNILTSRCLPERPRRDHS